MATVRADIEMPKSPVEIERELDREMGRETARGSEENEQLSKYSF